MYKDRIPKTVFHGEVVEGRTSVDDQKLRCEDVAKRHMKSINIGVDGWEELAADLPNGELLYTKGRNNRAEGHGRIKSETLQMAQPWYPPVPIVRPEAPYRMGSPEAPEDEAPHSS